jgi:hypothetical protein
VVVVEGGVLVVIVVLDGLQRGLVSQRGRSRRMARVAEHGRRGNGRGRLGGVEGRIGGRRGGSSQRSVVVGHGRSLLQAAGR